MNPMDRGKSTLAASGNMSGSMTVKAYDPEAMTGNGGQPLLETVAVTDERLQRIEARLHRLRGVLHGEYAVEGCDKASTPSDPSVRYYADGAYNTSVRIENLLDEIIQRTEC